LTSSESTHFYQQYCYKTVRLHTDCAFVNLLNYQKFKIMNILHPNLQNESRIKSRGKIYYFYCIQQWLIEVTKRGCSVTDKQANKTGLSVGENSL